MDISFLIFQVFCLIVYFQQSFSKMIEGELITDENWAFLSRFCFLSNFGRFDYQITYPQEYSVQSLLMYYDTKQQWPSAYKSNKTCEEKEELLSFDNGQIIYLTPEFKYSGCNLSQIVIDSNNSTINSVQFINCTHYRVFKSSRERWWFIAVSNCKSDKGLKLKYKITMTNDENNGWMKHFSADQFYILHTDLMFAVLYCLLLFGSIFEAYALSSRHLLHVTYKLYLLSLIAECLSLFFLTCYYGLYASDGIERHWIKLIGKTLEAISTLVFLMLLILLAKGYTITRGRIKRLTAAKMCAFMLLFTIIYGTILFYEQMFFDPGEVLYLYESWAGYGLIFLRLIGWTWFMYAIVFTFINYPTKSVFFTNFFFLYSFWFISTPIMILISTFVVQKWMREKIINAVELFIAFYAHTVFFILTRPSKANKNFPFHVRTTQIDVMSKTGEAAGETLDHFTHYGYAPSKPVSSRPLIHLNTESFNTKNKSVLSQLKTDSFVNKPNLETNFNSFINGYSNNSLPTIDYDVVL